MEKCLLKVQYSRCGYKHLDEQYFLRSNAEIPLKLKDCREVLDEAFFTWHDHTFSVIMPNEMLLDYLCKKSRNWKTLVKTISMDPTQAIETPKIRKNVDLINAFSGCPMGKPIDDCPFCAYYELNNEMKQILQSEKH